MEFKYLNGQNRRITLPPPRPLFDVAYFSRCPLQGYEFVLGSFFGNVLVPRVFPTMVPINAEEAFQQELETEQIRQKLEKEEIRREIIAGKIALARRQELENEVRREMVIERAFGIPMQRSKGISFSNNNLFGRSKFHLPSHFHGDNRQVTENSKDKVILLVNV